MGTTRLEVDLSALAHNYKYLTSKLKPKTGLMAVVKAFGYGSDGIAVASKLEALGVAYFAVAYASEGVALRKAGIVTPILVLHPQPDSFSVLIENCLEPSVYSARVLKEFIAFAKAKTQSNYPIHLKFNTGLNRLGFWETDTGWILNTLEETTAVKVKSIFSHLAASEDLNEKEFTLRQILSFTQSAKEMIDGLGYRPFLHQSNTSAILNYPESEFDLVRTGIGLYGFGNDPEETKKLKTVAALKTVISQIHKIEPGESVGYNRAFVAQQYETIAVIPIGHADGIARSYGNGIGFVYINDQKAPICGNVCMDMMMVIITGIDCKEGDEVIVFDQNHTAETLSKSIQSIPYELLTAISQRVERVIVT